MPAIRTFARPVNDIVTLSIPREYRSYSFEIMLVPVREHDTASPVWAGLCESAMTKNVDGPHDMASIRESLKSAKDVLSLEGLERANPGFVDRLICAEQQRNGISVLSCEKSFRRLQNTEVIP